MKCTHVSTGQVIAAQVEEARTFWARLKGLMGRKNLPAQTGLLLVPCPQIHTYFMRFGIDVVFMDATYRVVAVHEAVKPWRMSPFYPSARQCLELPAGTLQGRVRVGDELIFN